MIKCVMEETEMRRCRNQYYKTLLIAALNNYPNKNEMIYK